MSPLSPLGIFAFAGAAGGDYESIATVSVPSGGTATISFSDIPQTYKHLELRFITRGESNDDSTMRINGDSGSNYRWHILEGNGSSAYASNNGGSAATLLYVTRTPNGSTEMANLFAGSIMSILDYTSTNKYKVLRVLSGVDKNGSGTVTQWSGLYMSTSAVTSFTLNVQSGDYAEFSHFALYGLKG